MISEESRRRETDQDAKLVLKTLNTGRDRQTGGGPHPSIELGIVRHARQGEDEGGRYWTAHNTIAAIAATNTAA